MWLAIAILAQVGLSQQSYACGHDASKLLAQDQSVFDQSEAGWRSVAIQPRCEIVAADLIAKYRKIHSNEDPILYWHEGQLRAEAGATEEALRLFKNSRHPPNQWGLDDGWNLYVDATIAFLQREKNSLLIARSKIAVLPPPITPESANNRPTRKLRWPPNLDVVDGLIACFEKSYKEAYGQDCRKNSQQFPVRPISPVNSGDSILN